MARRLADAGSWQSAAEGRFAPDTAALGGANRWVSLRAPLIVVAALTLIAACGADPSSNSNSGTSSPKASATSPRPSPTVVGPADGLTGFGATNAAWEANHRADSTFDPGSAYNRATQFASPSEDPRFADEYYGVSHDGGRVTNYYMKFPANTTIAKARARVLQELPDAKPRWFAVKGTCAQTSLGSKRLALAVPGSQGQVLVQFTSRVAADHYSPSDISTAILMLSADASAAEAPGC